MIYRDIVPITPSDTADLPNGACAGIWCAGNAGNVVVTTSAGVDRTLPIAPGFNLAITVKAIRVKSTSTTATTLYALYV